ncbi:MAG: alpha-L-fucosidase, partial [Lentisphaeraceae bacterium]|nr:alpha-L-fucosidase [Lentisphaeraceae bacterium]
SKNKDQKYWEEYYYPKVVKEQIRELLSNYGKISIMWFDSPVAALSEEIADYVHQLQPDCVVNGRVGAGAGEYDSTYDSTIKSVPSKKFWEYCSTIGESWAYRHKENQVYSSARALTQYLIDVAGKNGMNLLNLGPRADGSVNPEDESRMLQVGDWMAMNKDAFHATEANPYDMSFDFGTILSKGNKLYLHFFGWPKTAFKLYGLKNKVVKASVFTSSQQVSFKQSKISAAKLDCLELELPLEAPDSVSSVIVLELDGEVETLRGILPQSDYTVVLEPALAKIISTKKRVKSKVESRSDGRLIGWNSAAEKLIWQDVYFAAAGTYEMTFLAKRKSYRREGKLPVKAQFKISLIQDNSLESFPLNFTAASATGPFLVGNKKHIAQSEHLRIDMHLASHYASGTLKVSKAGVYRVELSLNEDLVEKMRFRQLILKKR